MLMRKQLKSSWGCVVHSKPPCPSQLRATTVTLQSAAQRALGTAVEHAHTRILPGDFR
jgi:hypothetical protein